MARFAEVRHEIWIAAQASTVKAQFADLRHHMAANVHPKLRFRLLEEGPGRMRYEQTVRLLGLAQRDVFERRIGADTIVDTSVEGFNQGGSLAFRFVPAPQQGQPGTWVEIVVRLPLPAPLAWLRPLLAWQVMRELRQAAAEDKRDIEGGYTPQTLQAAA